MTETSSAPFGRSIVATRQACRLTQAAVADALGVERSYLSRVERGKSRPFQGDKLRRLVQLLGAEETELAALAAASRAVYRLTGVGVSEQHRMTGSTLATCWHELDAARLAPMLALVTMARKVEPLREPTEFGGLVQGLRLDRAWSQQHVAAAVGVARSHLSMVETGRQPAFGPTKIAALAHLFGVEMSSLVQKAARAKASYRLQGAGVSDLHRTLGAALEARWKGLPRETLTSLCALAQQASSAHQDDSPAPPIAREQ